MSQLRADGLGLGPREMFFTDIMKPVDRPAPDEQGFEAHLQRAQPQTPESTDRPPESRSPEGDSSSSSGLSDTSSASPSTTTAAPPASPPPTTAAPPSKSNANDDSIHRTSNPRDASDRAREASGRQDAQSSPGSGKRRAEKSTPHDHSASETHEGPIGNKPADKDPGSKGKPKKGKRSDGCHTDEAATAQQKGDGNADKDAKSNGKEAISAAGPSVLENELQTPDKRSATAETVVPEGVDVSAPQASVDPQATASKQKSFAKSHKGTEASLFDESTSVQPDAAKPGATPPEANAADAPAVVESDLTAEVPAGRSRANAKRTATTTDDPAAPSADAAEQAPTAASPPSQAIEVAAASIAAHGIAALKTDAKDEGSAKAHDPTVAATEGTARTAGHQISPAAPRTSATQTASGPKATASPDATQVDPARFVQRVSSAFRALGDRGGTVRLKLSPPELGSLKIEITLRGGGMSAKVETDNATTRNLLLDNLPALRERLAQQDIKVQHFQIDLTDRSAGGLNGQNANQSQSQGQQTGHHTAHGSRSATEPSLSGSPDVDRRFLDNSQLNVLV